MNNPVNWFEIYVQDMDRARKFYETVLQLKLEDMQAPSDMGSSDEFMMVAFPMDTEKPNAGGALVKAMGVDSGGSGTMVYFACEDCATEQGRVEAAGGKVIKPKFSIGNYGAIAICMDTEGNCFGLHSMS